MMTGQSYGTDKSRLLVDIYVWYVYDATGWLSDYDDGDGDDDHR